MENINLTINIGVMSNIRAIGIDLAKEIFHLHAVDDKGCEVFKKRLTRIKLIEFMNNLDCNRDKTIIGMEGCSGANYFVKKFRDFGYRNIRVVSAQFVKPFVKSNKNDSIDACAIVKAILDPDMRFCLVKEDWQQDIMNIHRVRSRLIKQRTALGNEIRGLLAEYGIISAKTISKLRQKLMILLNSDESNLSDIAKELFYDLFEELVSIDEKIQKTDVQLRQILSNNKLCQKLIKIPGIGLISSTALVGDLGNASNFKNGRELSAYLGLVPKQHSSGGKNTLLGISKRGNSYLRTLLIHASRSAVNSMNRVKDINNNQFKKNKKLSDWFLNLQVRKNSNVAVVALANKLARICFVVLSKEYEYEPN